MVMEFHSSLFLLDNLDYALGFVSASYNSVVLILVSQEN